MSILTRYIAQVVLLTVLAMLFLIVGLDVVFSFIGELESLRNNYQMTQALLYILTTIPGRLAEFIPVATLLGCLVGLGTLANTSELTAMRAAGISIARIVFAACLPVLLVVGLGLVLSEYLVPRTEQAAEGQRTLQISGDESFSTRHGFWYRDEQYFIHIKALQPSGVMYGVARFRLAGQTLQQADYSERAIYQGDHWVLEDVKQTRLAPALVEKQHLDTLRWETSLTPELLSIVVLEPDHLSISGLYTYSWYLASQGLDSAAYYFAFWKKTLQPLATLVMVFIAISFIFGPLRSVTMGQRVMAGVMVGLTFNYAQDILGHISIVFNVNPLLAASVPIVVCLSAGVYLLRKA